MQSKRLDQRKTAYKKTVDPDESRRRREDTANAIRKNKREESLLKKRAVGGSPSSLERRVDPAIAQKVCLVFFMNVVYLQVRSRALP